MLRFSYSTTGINEAGADEAGRGCLAGPVYAAAVILPPGFESSVLNDSKQLTEKQRDILRNQIEREALAWCVESVNPAEIDKINILNASFLAMHKSIAGLSIKPALLLIDGNRFRPYPGIDHQCIIRGDGIYMSIAAASILAKTHRDQFMMNLHKEFPEYGWDQNKGYATEKHRKAILKYGRTPWHRMTFTVSSQMKINF